MTAFRADFAVLVLALGLCAPAARAQWMDPSTPPVVSDEDLPPVADEPAPAATPATAPPKALPGAVAAPVATGQIAPPTDIQVGALGTVEGAPTGLLDSTNGGLGDDLWGGSARRTVEALLARAPLVSSDPALRALTKRIVLTKAAAPLGSAKRAFVTIRIERLLDAGLIDDAGALAASASVPSDDDFARVQANALLIDGRGGDVCTDRTAARLTLGDAFWLELRTYCYATSGDQAATELTHSVIDAQGYADPAFDALMDDVLNKKTVVPGQIAHPTAMHIFLMRQAALPISGALASVMGTPENLLAMRDIRNSPRVRLDAADRIIRTGAADISALKLIADAQDIPLSNMANASTDAQQLPFFAGQVLLRRAIAIETRPDPRAQLLFEALSLGDKNGLLPLAAELQGDALATLKPTPTNRSMGSMFARALLLAGHPGAARAWLSDRDAMTSVVDLIQSNPARDAKLQAALGAFATGLVRNPPLPDTERSYKALILGIADVLGRPLPPDAKKQAPALEAGQWDGARPNPSVMRNIENVSGHPERKGEALLLILDTIRSVGLRDMAPDTTIELVRLLGAIGVPDAARDIGMEALMLYVAPPPAPKP